jgi:hypothetical protein
VKVFHPDRQGDVGSCPSVAHVEGGRVFGKGGGELYWGQFYFLISFSRRRKPFLTNWRHLQGSTQCFSFSMEKKKKYNRPHFGYHGNSDARRPEFIRAKKTFIC